MDDSSHADAGATHPERVDPRVASASPGGDSCDLPTVAEPGQAVVAAMRERPERVGRYRVEAELGRGGMGVVYRAHDPRLDRTVAIKVVHQRRHASSDARMRLLREARTLAQLSHPNVIEVFEVGEHEGQVFIAMEFVAGQSLRAWLAEASRSPAQIIDAFVQAGRGLAAAHAAGLVHRDFKPDNAMRSGGRDARVRVLDFGLARTAEPTTSVDMVSSSSVIATDEKLTATGATLGTPAYMAPEQFRGSTDDPRSDQFSFCTALHEALFGKRPIAGKTMNELAANAAAGRIEVHSGHAVPARVVRALRRGLARTPADRFPTMAALLEAIEREHPRRGPAIVLVGVGGLAIAGIAWAALDDDGCPDAAELREALWSDADRESVRGAIAATELAYATATWERIDAELEAYAEKWTAVRIEACSIDEAARDSRLECLRAGRMAVRAAVDALARTDADTLHNATRIVAGLPDFRACIDAGEPVTAEPIDPQHAANVERIAQGLAEVDALIRLGHWDDADERLASWKPEVESASDDHLAARFHLVQGRLRLAGGRGLDAAQSFAASFFAATEAGDDTLALEAACLAMAEGALPYQERWRWAGHVDATQERIGRDDDVLAASCARARCRLLRDSGQLDDAVGSCEQAVAILEASVDAEATAGALRDLAATVAAAEDRERAYALHTRALAITVDAFGDEHPLVADALDELGTAALALSRVDEAETLVQRAARIRGSALRPEHPDHARTWALEGGVARAREQHERALERYRRVLQRRVQAHGDVHPAVARAHYDVALSLEHLRRYEEAMSAMQQVAAIEEQLHPLNIARIPTLRELARMAFTFGTGPSAGLDYLERAQMIVAESSIPADHPLVRDLEHGHGETLLELGRAEEALPHLERFVADPRPHRVLHHVEFVLARALWELDRDRPRALELVAGAMAAYEGDDDEFARQQVREMTVWLQTKQPPEGARGWGRRELE